MKIVQQFENAIRPNLCSLNLNEEEIGCIRATFPKLLSDKQEHWNSVENKEDLVSNLKIGFAVNDRCFLITGQIDFWNNTVRWAAIEEMELDEALDMMNQIKNNYPHANNQRRK